MILTLALGAPANARGQEADGGPLGFPAAPANPPIEGQLIDGGVECPAMNGADGTLYTLLGDLDGFRSGDRVCIVPSYVEVSFCMQGTTVHVDWIGPAPCPPG
ncbi:MAG: DUF5818 domain-containing protein [Dongiaceae bacterium]